MACVRTALLIAFLLVTRAAPSNNPPAPAPQSEGEENPYTGEGEGEDYSPEPAHPPEVPNPSWPPSWPPSPPQLPGYCADTCETANDGVCDELSGQSEETASYRSEFAGDPDLDPFGSLDDGKKPCISELHARCVSECVRACAPLRLKTIGDEGILCLGRRRPNLVQGND
eukprot:6195443-Pleurochrysis_carterae.AAC.2